MELDYYYGSGLSEIEQTIFCTGSGERSFYYLELHEYCFIVKDL